MSTFATQARLVLAQHEVPGKANEITALPELMKQLDLCGQGRLRTESVGRP
ncbi:hypothetical protein [Azotobacter armeniacus]